MQLESRTETRLRRIIDTAYYVLILFGAYYFVLYAFWPVFPFLFSFFVAMSLQKPMAYAHKRFKVNKSVTAIVLVLLFYLVIIGILGYAGAKLFGLLKGFVEYISSLEPAEILRGLALRVPELLRWLPEQLHESVDASVGDFVEKLDNGENTGLWALVRDNVSIEWFKTPVSGLLATAGKIPALLLAGVITVIASFFMTLGYDSMVRFIKRQLSPARREGLSAAKRVFTGSLGKMTRSYLILMVITFAELMLGLGLLLLIGPKGIFETKYLIPICLVIAVWDLIPVLGAGSVMTIWALYHLIMQNYGLGLGIFAASIVIFLIRQVVEPKLLASNLGLPPIVTIMGMYIGLQLFGILGMTFMPLLLVLIKLLNEEGVIRVWKNAGDG